MKNNAPRYGLNTKDNQINARQLCFFVAFFLPLGKLLELPSLLTSYAGGDLLIAALVGCLTEFLSFAAILFFCKKVRLSPFEYLERKWGKLALAIVQVLFSLFLLIFATLPLFDLEKFSHAAFSDTSPTFFVFTPFFILSGFLCAKSLKGIGRVADLSPLLVLVPILGLLGMSVGQADFSRLLPIIEKPFSASLKAFWKTTAYFSSGGILLPLVSGYHYTDGDEKKLLPAFGGGVLITLLFLATFFSVFGLLGTKEHFAVMKIAQFFPALKFIGRIDLLLIYSLSIGLFYYTAIPLQLFTESITHAFSFKSKLPTAVLLSVGLYFCLLFGNKYTTLIHTFFAKWLAPVFLFFSFVFPLLLLILSTKTQGQVRNESHSKQR